MVIALTLVNIVSSLDIEGPFYYIAINILIDCRWFRLFMVQISDFAFLGDIFPRDVIDI